MSKISDLYGEGETGNLLRGEYHTDAVYAWFQKRHAKGASLLDEDGVYRNGQHEWGVPYGVRVALHTRLFHAQIANRYPWYVTWRSPKTGKRLRKYCNTLPQAIKFVAEKAQYVDSQASIVCRHGQHVPPKLRGKFPRKGHYWCPCCMAPRKFRRVYHITGKPQTFFAMKKFPVTDPKKIERGQLYEWKDVRLALMRCVVCGISNRDHKFRASNQPFEVRKFKRGVTRARRRRKKVRR